MGGVQLAQRPFDCLADEEGAVVGIPEFGGDPVFAAGEIVERRGKASTNEQFVGVRGGGIEVGVAGVESCGDGVGGGGVVGGEPETEADGGDGDAGDGSG